MSLLKISATKTTPLVDLDPASGTCLVKGESYPENALSFYQPLLDALAALDGARLPKGLKVTFELAYFNSSSSRMLFKVFDQLTQISGSGGQVSVLWRYDEDDSTMEEFGEEFEDEFPDLDFEVQAM